jgi:hypothetical protein
LKSRLLTLIQEEILKHDLSAFVEDRLAVGRIGTGLVVTGCPTCKKRLNTARDFRDHLANDAMPALLERLTKLQEN